MTSTEQGHPVEKNTSESPANQLEQSDIEQSAIEQSVIEQRTILFFFFTINDEFVALKAAQKTIYQSKKNKNKITPADAILNMYKYWNKFKKKNLSEKASLSHETSWKLPEDVDLGLWRQFLRESNSEEFLVVLWAKILKFSEQHIADGIGVSVGTVRHRLNRGLKFLGSLRVK